MKAQLSLNNVGNSATINFSTTIAGVNNGSFNASGFVPAPAAGQLDSDGWAVTGWSNGDLAFGGTQVSADYTRGNTAGGVTTAGIYSYTPNPGILIQPATSDFTPGTLTLKVLNSGTTPITQFVVSYNIYERNDQGRGTSLNFSYSLDNITYTPVSIDYSSPIGITGSTWVQIMPAPSRSTTIPGLTVTAGSNFYIRWSSDDFGGSGSRDEIILDDINVVATYFTPCVSTPSINATLNAATSVLSNQMQVNFTRGNGSGGLLAVVSPAVLSSNPVNGVSYTANANYGTGTVIGNGFVVYNSNAVTPAPGGTGNFILTGLTPATLYTITLFEYDAPGPCYTVSGTSGTQMTATTSATQTTDLFRSRITGNWANASTWESFTSGSWITATLSPTAASAGISILAAHTIDITSSVSMDQTVISGTLSLFNSGVINLANGAGTDIDIQGTGLLWIKSTSNYTTTFAITAGATLNVATGGKITVGNGGSSPGYSPLASTSGLTVWNNGSIFEWNSSDPFLTSNVTYFPDAAASVIPIFRVSRTPSLVPGAGPNTVWNGLMEVNANLTLRLGGAKVFRNGIIGTANLIQNDDCGAFTIGTLIATPVTAQLGGTGIITLNLFHGFISSGCVTTMISDKIINLTTAGNTFRVSTGGTLHCGTYILSGTVGFAMSTSATLGMGSPTGIASSGPTGNVQTSIRSFDPGTPWANFIYNGSVDQATGTGLPLTVNSLTINNSGVANQTVTLTTTNTTTPTLNLSDGLFAIGSGAIFNISSGGTVNATTGDFATGSVGGTLNFPGPSSSTFYGNSNPYNVTTSSGVDFNGSLGNVVTIQAGGAFQLNNNGYANNYGPFYASTSTLVYNTTGTYNIYKEWNSGITFGARAIPYHVTLLQGGLTLENSDPSISHGVRSIFGDLVVSPSTVFTLSTTAVDDLNISGNWSRHSSATFVHNTRLVNFNGKIASQTITVTGGGGTETFGYMKIDKTAQSLILAGSPNATNVTLAGSPGSTTPTYILDFNTGDIDLNQQTFSFYAWNGINAGNQNKILINGVTGNFTRNIKSPAGQGFFSVLNNAGGTHNILIDRNGSVNNTKKLIFSADVKVTIGVITDLTGFCGIDFGYDGSPVAPVTTINGILQINSHGYVTVNGPIYGLNSTLIYNPGGIFNRNPEWGSASTAGASGYPYDVVVQNNTNLFLNTTINGTGNRYMAGTLNIKAGSSVSLSETTPTVFGDKLYVRKNLILDGTLTLPTALGGDLRLAGNWTRSLTGVFIPNDRAVFFDSSIHSTITANNGQAFDYIYLAKANITDTLYLADSISVSKQFGVKSGTLGLQSKNVTLLSNVNATASMGQAGATGRIRYTGTGRFVIERFIPTATVISSPLHKKTWQFLATPISDSSQTVKQAWQEGALTANGNPKSGYGTQLTSNVANAATQPKPGFDVFTIAGPSVKTYVPGTSSWKGIDSTGIPIINQKGYMIFVRGDRSVTTFNPGVVPTTTLRVKGKIYDPSNLTPPVTTIVANKFESIGNPYPSAIDFSNDLGVVKSNAFVQRVFYVWDPRLGGNYGYGAFQTFTKGAGTDYTLGSPGGGSYPGTPGITVYNNIESGQAFFVRAVGGTGNVTINELAKVTPNRLVARIPFDANNIRQICTRLYVVDNGNNTLVDGVLNQFHKGYSNNVDVLDAVKLMNTSENLGISKGDQLLSVERQGIIRPRDTIQYDLTQLMVRQYQFEFLPLNIDRPGIKAFLVDKYQHTHTPVSLTDTTRVNFNVSDVPASYASDRFMLVFMHRGQVHPVTDNVLEGQITGNDILLNWKGNKETEGLYDVERSPDGISYTNIHSEAANETGSYSWKDNYPFPGTNYYRIRYTDGQNNAVYSNRVKIVEGGNSNSSSVSVFPNPVTNGVLGLHFRELLKGNYSVKLYSSTAQLVLSENVFHSEMVEDRTVNLPAISKGLYKLEIIYPDGTLHTEKLLIQ